MGIPTRTVISFSSFELFDCPKFSVRNEICRKFLQCGDGSLKTVVNVYSLCSNEF